MNEKELYIRFMNMQGEAEDRVAFLANLYGMKVKDIREAIQRQASLPPTIKAVTPEDHMRECHPGMNVYHPDTNPFCKIRIMVPEDKVANTAVYKRLDELDKEIKTLDEKKKLLEIEYKALVDHMGGTSNE